MSNVVTPEHSPSYQSEGDVNLSPQRTAWQLRNIGAATRQLLADDERYFLRQSLSTPCLNVMQSCGGAWIEDIEGRRYLDFHGNAVHQVGFGNSHVIEAIKRQLDTLPFCTRRYTNPPAIALAKRLADLAPGDLNKVLFAPGGTSAIGMALKLARIVTGKFKTVSLWESFHGASLDAISVGGEALFRKGVGPLLPGTEHVPPPDPMEGPWPDLEPDDWAMKSAEYLEYVLEREAGDVGAVIAETIRWTPFVPPVEYWQKIRAACDRHGALLILDEVPACLGRTGKMFACEHYGIVPDMLVIGKGLGGGVFPLAALLAREGLDRYETGALGHYTHEKNPVAAAAGLATLDVIEAENFLQRVQQLGNGAIAKLRELQKRYTIIREVRGIGLMLGVVLKLPDDSKAVDAAEWIMYRALDKGLSFKITMGCILTLTPALTIEDDELALALSILDECFQEMPAELTISKP
ncbi:MAG: aspartate aminotransferase family protein [Verrucomicrobiales bacterium]